MTDKTAWLSKRKAVFLPWSEKDRNRNGETAKQTAGFSKGYIQKEYESETDKPPSR